MIFQLSNQNGDDSSNLSKEVASFFVTGDKIAILEPYIRKIAHISEYTIGGMLFFSFFLTYHLTNKKRIFFSLLIGIEYATLDEIHQLFIDGRAGQFKDVVIDTIGITLGICIMMLCYKIRIKMTKPGKDGVSHKQE